MSYSAIVCKIKTRPLENADKLKLATVLGYQVVVGLDTNEEELQVFFPLEGQISEEFARANDLIRRKNEVTGLYEGGFFEVNRRVRCQKFRGAKSEGFLAPLSFFEFTGFDILKLKEGDSFTELNGIPICSKYITPGTRNAGGQNQPKVRRKILTFPEHFETEQLKRFIKDVPAGAILYFSEKIHGCVERTTKIETLEKGLVEIGEIVDKKLLLHVKCYDIETSSILYQPIEDWYTLKNEEDWYQLEMEDGTILIITGNNPIWLPELSCYRRVDQLRGNEILLTEK